MKNKTLLVVLLISVVVILISSYVVIQRRLEYQNFIAGFESYKSPESVYNRFVLGQTTESSGSGSTEGEMVNEMIIELEKMVTDNKDSFAIEF